MTPDLTRLRTTRRYVAAAAATALAVGLTAAGLTSAAAANRTGRDARAAACPWDYGIMVGDSSASLPLTTQVPVR
jgi:hypothetical protein